MNNDFLYLSLELINNTTVKNHFYPDDWVIMKPLNKRSILQLDEGHTVNYIGDEIEHMNYLISKCGGELRIEMIRAGFLNDRRIRK